MAYITLHGLYPSGYYLTSSNPATGVSITSTGYLIKIGLRLGELSTVVNYGTLFGQGGYCGVTVEAGALVKNHATITGAYGIWDQAGALSVTNSGEIIGMSATARGIEFNASGSVLNAKGGTISAVSEGTLKALSVGVSTTAGAVVTVDNYGTISGDISVYLNNSSDRVIVENGAVFSGAVKGGQGTLELRAPTGTISTLGGAAAISGAETGDVSGFSHYQFDAATAWSLIGSGSIASTSVVTSSGALTNAGTLVNSGSLASSGTFVNSGVFTNKTTVANTGVIIDSGTLTNDGFIGAGSLTVTGSLFNYGSIRAPDGAFGVGAGTPGGAGTAGANLVGGWINNSGTILGGAGGAGSNGTGGTGGAGGAGIDPPVAGGTLINYGVVRGGHGGTGGGSGSNGGTGGAGGAGELANASTTILNYGLIQAGVGGAAGAGEGLPGLGGAGGAGLALNGGGLIKNQGTIAGAVGGIGSLGGAAGAAGDGVDLTAGGTVINGYAGGTLSALIQGKYGVYASSTVTAATVVDYGTIVGTGGYSVVLKSAGSSLQVEDGAHFTGWAYGGGGKLSLFENGGTLTGLGGGGTVTGAVGMSFSNFGQVMLGAGTWTLAGLNQVYAGQTFLDEAATLANTGTLADLHGGTILVSGLVNNTGTVSLASAGTLTDLRLTAGGAATLTGGGVVSLSGADTRILGGNTAATLTNVDNTIAGSGFIGVGQMTLINDASGVIDATGSKQSLTVILKGSSSVNSGLMEASSGATLVVLNSSLDQTGGGTISALTGGRVDLENTTLTGGSLAQAGTGVLVENLTGTALIGTTMAVSLSGVLEVLNATTLTVDGAIANAGKIDTFGAAKILIGAEGATLSGGGQVNLFANLNSAITGGSGTLTNIDNRIAGAGTIGGASMTLVNQAKGIIAGSSNISLILNTGENAIQNAGAIQSASTGQVTIASAVINTGLLFAASGTLNVDGAVTAAGTAQIKSGVLNIAAAFGETVTFVSGATGDLRLTDYKDFTGVVKGLSTTGANAIQIAGMPFVSGKSTATYSGTTASGVLTITNGTVTASVTLTGNYVGHTFTVSNGGGGISTVKDPSTPAAPLVQAMAATGSARVAMTELVRERPPGRLPMLHAQA